jgi:hypothetical protein
LLQPVHAPVAAVDQLIGVVKQKATRMGGFLVGLSAVSIDPALGITLRHAFVFDRFWVVGGAWSYDAAAVFPIHAEINLASSIDGAADIDSVAPLIAFRSAVPVVKVVTRCPSPCTGCADGGYRDTAEHASDLSKDLQGWSD